MTPDDVVWGLMGAIMIARFFAALFSAFFLFCSAAAAAPLEAYSRLPMVSDVTISEDGAVIAYTISRNETQRVVVQSVDGQILRQIDFTESKVRFLQWAGPDHVLITRSTTHTLQGRFYRGEFFQTASLNVRTGAMMRLLRDFRGRVVRYENIVAGTPIPALLEGQNTVLVHAFADTWPYRFDIVRVDLDTGTGREFYSGEEEDIGHLVRRDGAILTREQYDQVTGRYSMAVRQGNQWRIVHNETSPVDLPQVNATSADGRSIIATFFDPETQFWRPRPISIETGAMGDWLFPPGEIGIITDRDEAMVGHWSDVGRHGEVRYDFDDPGLQTAWRQLTESFPGENVRLVSATPDFSKLIVSVDGASFAGDYFLYDIRAGSLNMVGRAYPEIPTPDIAEVREITYAASDGLEIPAFLTLPRGRDPRALPLVVMPHGGPESMDVRGFDWMAQAIASRGYAVLQPNFRGSSGLGQAFLEAGYGQYGRRMQTDVSDGVAHLAQQGIIDPARVCVMGASYGGYVALAGVTVQSGIYRCAIAVAGVSDPGAQLERTVMRSGSRTQDARYRMRYLGVEGFTDPALREISPIVHAADGTAPVLLIHGRDDTVVLYSHSAEMQAALRRAGREVQMVDLAAEDHWLSREATRRQMLEAAVAFLERHNPPN